jgi:hypothetical protein
VFHPEGVAVLLHYPLFKELFHWVRGFQSLSAVLVAEELHLWDQVRDLKGVSPQDLSQKLGITPSAGEVLIRLLSSLRFLEMREGKVYPTPFSLLFLGRSAPFSLSPFLEFLSVEMVALSRLKESLLRKEPLEIANIFHPSPYMYGYLFAVNRFLYEPSFLLLKTIGTEGIRSAIMGSMGVSFASALSEMNREVRITFGCLDHLVKEIPNLLKIYPVPEHRIEEICSHEGDPGTDHWGKGEFDLVLLTKKFVLKPEEKLGERFAERAFRVLRPGGRVVIWETIYPEDGKVPKWVALNGFQDLIPSYGGAFYTQKKMEEILRKIGFLKVDFYTFSTSFGPAQFVVGTR